MNRSIRVRGAFVCTVVVLGGCAILGWQGPKASAAVLLDGTNLDYADPASWDIAGVPGDASHSTHPAIIASSGHGTRSAVYSSSTNFTTTSRLLLGHTSSGNGTLTMKGSAGTLTFHGNSYGGANYVGVDGGTGTLNVEAGTLAIAGDGWLRIGSNAAGATGTVNLSGSGAITVGQTVLVGNGNAANSGEVNISGNGQFAANRIIIADNTGNGTLNLNGGVLELASLSIGTGTGVFNMGGGTLRASGALNAGVPIQLTAGTSAIDTNGHAVTLGGVLSGDGSLRKTGSGTLTLTVGNTYTGPTTVSEGVLEVLGEGSLYSDGTFAGNISVEQDATLRFARNNTFGNAAANPAVTITVNGGTVTTVGKFAPLGPLTLNGGTLTGTAGVNSTYQMYSLLYPVTVGGSSPSSISGPAAGSPLYGGIHLGSSANPNVTFDVADATGDAAADLTVSAALIDRNVGQGGGSGGLTKRGAGTMALTAGNTYSGHTIVQAGQLDVTGTVTGVDTTFGRFIVGGGTGNNGTLRFDMGAGTSTFYADGFTNSCDIGVSGGSGSLVLDSGTLNVATRSGASRGSIRLGVYGASTGTLTVNGGALNVPGRILMAANATTTSATLTVNGGEVNLGTAGQGAYSDPGHGLLWTGVGTSTVNLNGGTLTLYAFNTTAAGTVDVNLDGGTLKAQNHNATFVGAAGTFNMNVKAGGAILDTAGYNITLARPLVHDGALGATPDGGLTKLGAGTLAITSASTYTGATTINAGTLLVTGSLGNTDVAVNSGGTLAGTGPVGGTVTINGGGAHAPGASVGPQTVGGETWMPGGRFEFEINDALGTAGGFDGWDLVTVDGVLNLEALGTGAGEQFVIDIVSLSGDTPGDIANFVPTEPREWEFITYDSLAGEFQSELFAIDADDFTNELGTGYFRVVHNEQEQWLAVGFVPEPGSLLLLLAALVCGLSLRRR